MDIAHLRKEYRGQVLNKKSVPNLPIDQFSTWFKEAQDAELLEPNAMVVATSSKEGVPSCRTVLLKYFDQEGFVFYTNYRSKKGFELEANPAIAATFLWLPLARQVIVEGVVEKQRRSESEAYFKKRPREAQLSAWASKQGTAVPTRDTLNQRYQQVATQFEGEEISCPKWWGGYRIVPSRIEFWQGRVNRLHDRLSYQRDGATWNLSRLSP